MSKEGIDVAYARCPEGHDTDADGWAFFEKHYVKLVKLALWWTEKFGKSAVSEEFDLDVHVEEYSSAILDAIVGELSRRGGTYLTVASVWYVWAVTAEGFSAAGDMRYRSDLEHQGLYWWMAYELLSFASADPQVIVLPSAPKASEEDKAGLREWVLAEAEKCSDRLVALEAQVNGAGSLTFYLDETYEMPKHPLKRVADSGVDESGSSSQKENAEPKDI